MNELIKRKRSGKEKLDDPPCIAVVKKYSTDTCIKVTQWNCNCVRSTWIHQPSTDTWFKIGDREDIYTYHTPEDFDHAVIVVHTENYIHPQGFVAELEPDEETAEFIFPIVTMAQSTRKSVLEGSRAVHDADVTMWKHIDHEDWHYRDKEIKSWNGCVWHTMHSAPYCADVAHLHCRYSLVL